jgi:hypothetical protein
MSDEHSPAALLNARYVAIRTAEAKGLTDRLIEAARDRTPGVRRLLIPILYRYWRRDREHGWEVIEKISGRMVNLVGMLDRDATEILGALSMPILNACRSDPGGLERLAAIWRRQLGRLFDSPLAKTARAVGVNPVLRWAAGSVVDVMKRQPIYQPVNYAEMAASFGRDQAFRAQWRHALACLEQPELSPAPLERILTTPELPYDLYLMMICERGLLYYAARTDPAGGFDYLERLYREARPWFRHSVIYVLFHVLSFLPEVPDDWLARYDALALDFFRSGAWRLTTTAGTYVMATHAANADVAAALRRPGRAPKVIPTLMKEAIAADDEAQVEALFAAIDGVAFYHGAGALALAMLEAAALAGGERVERRMIASLASVRLLDQPLVDASLQQRRSFAGLSPERVAATEPSITEEDLLTLLDGFIVHSMLTSDALRLQLCALFRRALTCDSPEAYLVTFFQYLRDELTSQTAPK